MMKLISLLLVLSCVSLISAHITVSPSQVSNVGSTMLMFNVPHSCEASVLTSKLAFVFPPDITSVKPVMKSGWMVNVTSVDLGYTIKGVEALNTIYTYTALPGYEIPQWMFDAVYFRLSAPPAPNTWTVGSKFYIPVYQYCTNNLLSAWNSTPPSSSESGPLPAPAITVLDPSAIQVNPTQANVQALASQLATLTNSTSTLNVALSSYMSSISSSSSSDWIRSDTIGVIAIILAGISILACVVLVYKLSRVEEQNLILRKKLQSIMTNEKEYGEKPLPKDTIQLTPVEKQIPIATTPIITTTRPSTSEGQDDGPVTLQVHEQ